MRLMSPTDSMFLLTESREHPMHVGGLQLFEPPDGAGPEFARESLRGWSPSTRFQPTFRKHPATIWRNHQCGMVFDDGLDHRLSPAALGAAVAGTGARTARADFAAGTAACSTGTARCGRRIFVEGLNDGRFAVYSKFHHALIDGVSALKLMQRALTAGSRGHRHHGDVGPATPHSANSETSRRLARLAHIAGSVAALGSFDRSLARAALLEQQLTLPFAAPRTMFNVRSAERGGAPRNPGRWTASRSVKSAAGVTVNDVVLAMCSGALRTTCIEQSTRCRDPR